ncbi:kinase-like protein [Aspergillus neoniger CBS 115656]|uniref:non-specific serine/threonine protein kinase n=1 Tax=Aspergillus neoniger (strain CBS 115656) TaxID=1448310 RepID=A0A318YH38_ASPNB|nr:kinase-like protein [Aspergillus neoniger CBS 115656]PYH33037.1 kinase-like protein [Aspergillus neoniger CBS 115656]
MTSVKGNGTSDTVKNAIEYMPIEDVEKFERYRPGGYHPTTIGEWLNDRYRIVHKLGFGAYSTIWMARDQKTEKYVAVKITIADCNPTNSQERNILHRLGIAELKAKAHPGSAIIPSITDEFTISGPNGVHQCFVTSVGMMNLAEAKDASSFRLFQLPVARAFSAQVVLAVAYLHSQGIVHADLHPGNILILLPESMDSLSPEQFYERHGQPHHEPVTCLDQRPLPDGVPAQAVVPVWLGKASEEVSLSEAQIVVTDFGESFMPATTARHHSNTSGMLVPPETYFEPQKSLSFSADIWTLACTIWEIIGQRPLLEGFNPSVDWVVKEHVDTFGKLPLPWWQKWESRSKWFNEDGTRHGITNSRPWVQRFTQSVQKPREEFNMQPMGDAERTAFLTMLRDMLAFEPEKRPSAGQIMEYEWLQQWALPDLSRMKQNMP